MKETEIAYNKYKLGEPITDKELKLLIENHKSILSKLSELNNRMFDLFRNQLRHDLNSFEGFETARKSK